MISHNTPSERVRRVAQMIVLPLVLGLVAVSPTMADTDHEAREEVSKMRQELSELRESVRDLQSWVRRFVEERREKRSRDRDEDRTDNREGINDEDRDEGRDEGRVSLEWLKSRGHDADLNGHEIEALVKLAMEADLRPQRFERFLSSDDLEGVYASAVRKFTSYRGDDREEEHDDRPVMLSRIQLMRLGIDAD